MSGPFRQIDLGAAKGGQKPELRVNWTVVRELVEADLPAIQARETVNSPGQVIQELRSQHHEIAQLIAKGIPQQEICIHTGYSPSYLSVLKTDPAFKELVAYYADQRELIFADLLKREKDLALATLEELQSRLASDPNGWSKKELLELYEKLGGGAAGSGGKGTGGGRGDAGAAVPAVEIHFHTKTQGPAQVHGLGSKLIEGEVLGEGE